jgi:hypothetical protein
LESDEVVEMILFEGKVKQRVVKSSSASNNIGESVTKQKRVEGVT